MNIIKNTTEIKTVLTIISCSILLSIVTSACRNNSLSKAEVVTLIDKDANRIEKGIMLNDKKEGYWATFDTNYNILYDIQYVDNIPNGKTTMYQNNSIWTETAYFNGVLNGNYVNYSKYPIIYAQGEVKMGKRVGEWKIFTNKGELNKVVVYKNDTFEIKIDNNLDELDLGDETPRILR